ncbi:MAG: hypothetical protein OZSIB_3465 [Candidatus Ozemobacter sibiricus]|jgi:tetratricopeptide (TPR) repeat protein|uniref:Uncharacterized protein n=1 Tax=Candidatus Ozemobacter sibiricus TaxID=2268124 RepID=A0A367ZQ93_9BACT|nr:MAG: hypothetical protein OZSIB_3465 [Candidatus Ozemobacter sibiricus]
MNRSTSILLTIGLIILLASGCGGGGGGTGRYTLPGEIPGGSGGGGGTGTGTGGGGETDPDALLLSAWEDFKFGAYSSAISKFNQVLSIPNITDTHRTEAYNGIGWSQTKSAGVEAGYSAFTQAASTNNEARIGLAAALIQRGQQSGFSMAISHLEAVGLGNPAFKFQATHPIGVSNAEAHAMLAFCYFWRNNPGDHDKARAQINIARTEDGSNDSAVAHIYKTLKDLGLTGI